MISVPKLVLPAVRREACRIVFLPAIIASAIGILLLIFTNRNVGYSFLLGVAAWLIPNLLFAYRLFSNVSPRAANKIIKTFYLFEAIKLALTVILIVTIVKFFPVILGYIILGYFLTLIIFWVKISLKMKA